jgi:hypothetical protein
MSQALATAWFLTLALAIAGNVRKGRPVLNAFAPIRTYPGLYFSLASLAVACLFASLQFLTDVKPLGQQPITLASLFALVYSWVTIAYQLRKI